MLLAPLFAIFIPASFAQTMQALNGRLLDITTCSLIDLSFDDCSSECLSIPGCMIAYMEYNNQQCYLCPYGIISTIELDSTDIANLTIRCDNCTSPSNSYEDGTPLDGHVTVDSEEKYYYFSFSGSAWYITEDNGCIDNTWKRFSRVLGPWCILPYYSSTAAYDWDGANAHCSQAYNAVLSGLETLDELDFIDLSIRSQWSTAYDGFLWIGSKRRPECTYPAWDTSLCNNTATTFYWTDNFTTGTAGFRWAGGQPTGTLVNGEQESCMAVYESDNGWGLDGLVDDLMCSQGTVLNSLPASGHACGMKARH